MTEQSSKNTKEKVDFFRSNQAELSSNNYQKLRKNSAMATSQM